MSKTNHPHRDATSETTPWHIWHAAAHEMSGCSLEDLRKYVARERIQAAYNAGESVWMVADEIKLRVKQGRLADRADGEVAALRRVVRQAIR